MEEDARIALLLRFLKADQDNQIVDLLLHDCDVIKKNITFKKEDLQSMFILQNFLIRIQTFFGYVSNDVQSLQERFEYIINATEKLDQHLFQNNSADALESSGDE